MAIDKRLTGAAQVLTGLLALRNGFAVESLTGATPLTRKSAQILRLDPDGAARALTLPTDAEEGDFFVIANVGTAAEDITVNTSLVTITPTDFAIVAYVDGAWALIMLVAGVVS